MKPARIPQTVAPPERWAELPQGEYYREALELQLKPARENVWFHLLKIGNLSAEINTESCAISHQVSVSLNGSPVQVKADPLHLPFAEKSVMPVCSPTCCPGAAIPIVCCGKPTAF